MISVRLEINFLQGVDKEEYREVPLAGDGGQHRLVPQEFTAEMQAPSTLLLSPVTGASHTF